MQNRGYAYLAHDLDHLEAAVAPRFLQPEDVVAVRLEGVRWERRLWLFAEGRVFGDHMGDRLGVMDVYEHRKQQTGECTVSLRCTCIFRGCFIGSDLLRSRLFVGDHLLLVRSQLSFVVRLRLARYLLELEQLGPRFERRLSLFHFPSS